MPGLPFNDFLADDDISEIINHTTHKRDSIFTPLVTLKAFILQTLSSDGSCREAVVNVLTDRLSMGKSANSTNTGPYTKARQRLPLEQIKKATTNAGSKLHQQSDSRQHWKGLKPILVDGTTVTMPDTAKNQAAYPQQSTQKQGLGFPIARLVVMISLVTGGIIDYSLGPYQGKQTGESSLFSRLINSLSFGDLLMGDRYYCTFAMIALLQVRKVPVVFQMHASRKVNFSVGQKLGKKDHLLNWHKPKEKPIWMSESDYAELPETIRMREFSVDGIVYATTLLDEKIYSKKEVAIFYKQRWHIEVDLRAIKTHMGMDTLRCKTPEMVEKEIAVHFLAYTIIRGNMAQAAILHNKTPRKLSFKSTLQIIIQATKNITSLIGESLNTYLAALFKAISSNAIGLQKRKSQPRAVKKRPKAFPLLKVSRAEACANL